MNLIGTLQTTEFAGTRTRLIQFLTWWTRELGRLHSNFAASRTSSGAMFFRREGQTSLCVHEKDGWTERATLTDHPKRKDLQVFQQAVRKVTRGKSRLPLRLADDQILLRKLKVPAAAVDVLDQVVSNQIQRFVPWQEHETFYGFTALKAPLGSDEIEVILVLAQRQRIDELLEGLVALGTKPAQIEYADVENDALVVMQTLGDEPSEASIAQVRKTLKAASIAGSGLFLTGMLLAWGAQNNLSSIQTALADAQAEIESVEEGASDGAWFMRNGAAILKRKQTSPSMIALLDTISQNLPNTAYLTGLEIQGDKILLTGKAKNAALLIAALENSPLLNQVEFSAPTIRLSEERRDAFSISARIMGEAPDAAEELS